MKAGRQLFYIYYGYPIVIYYGYPTILLLHPGSVFRPTGHRSSAIDSRSSAIRHRFVNAAKKKVKPTLDNQDQTLTFAILILENLCSQ
jgi:hypothetical protein